jgi:hypothetical protein
MLGVMLGVEEGSCKKSKIGHIRGRRGVILGIEEESCQWSC